MKRGAFVVAGMVAVALCLAAASVAIRANSLAATLKIAYTNDTIGYLEPCG